MLGVLYGKAIPQEAGHAKKKSALPSYLQRRHRRLPDAAHSGSQRRNALHSVAADAGYAVIVAEGGYEADDFIGAICVSLQQADADCSTLGEPVTWCPACFQSKRARRSDSSRC